MGHNRAVTPYVGVWIETGIFLYVSVVRMSLLMWECGLKQCRISLTYVVLLSLLMWECGLKHYQTIITEANKESLLMWECGLKHNAPEDI